MWDNLGSGIATLQGQDMFWFEVLSGGMVVILGMCLIAVVMAGIFCPGIFSLSPHRDPPTKNADR
jgi:hypothetical protein